MGLWNLATTQRVANPTDAQIQAGVDFRNSCATQRPDIYGDPTYTLEQAKADIAGQQVGFYQTSGTLRGYVICNVCEYGDPDNGRSVAARIGDLVIDPSLFNATTIRTVMNLIKNMMAAFDVTLLRLVGEVYDDSPVWTQYMGPQGYRVITTIPEPSPTNQNRNLLLIDRFINGTNG